MARIAVGADHAGFRLKDELAAYLRTSGHEVLDLGTNSPESVDYPDYGAAVARAIVAGEADLGLACCGTGLGIAMAVNKVHGGRGAPCHDVTSARLARAHNNANVICFGERLTGPEVAREALDMFLSTNFEGGRHARRVEKLTVLDQEYDPG